MASILDLTPSNLTIKATRGDTYSLNIVVLNNDDTTRDITGSTITLTVKESGTIKIQKTATITSAVDGEATISIEVVDWVDVDSGFYDYDIEMIESSGDVTTLFIGGFNTYDDIKK